MGGALGKSTVFNRAMAISPLRVVATTDLVVATTDLVVAVCLLMSVPAHLAVEGTVDVVVGVTLAVTTTVAIVLAVLGVERKHPRPRPLSVSCIIRAVTAE